MQDRFRFRVWQAELQVPKMKYNSGIGFIKNQLDDTDCVIMQCTGFKDKNNNLIYEGDIINDKSNHIRVVVWEQDSFKYPALKTSRYFHSPISNKLEERKVDLRGKLTFQDNVYKCDKKHFEVIGNIYENPELLLHPTESEGVNE